MFKSYCKERKNKKIKKGKRLGRGTNHIETSSLGAIRQKREKE